MTIVWSAYWSWFPIRNHNPMHDDHSIALFNMHAKDYFQILLSVPILNQT